MAGMKSLPLEEVDSLINRLPAKYQALVALGVTTGCRISEVLQLRRFDVLTKDGNLKEKISFLKLKSKKGDTPHRKMPIPEKYRKYIIRHLLEEENRGYDRPDDLLFRGKLGMPLRRQTAYKVFRENLGEGFGTHWMRKTFAQEMFRYFSRKTPEDPMRALELCRRALGHARLDTTVKYLGITESSIEEAQNAIFNRE